MEPEVMLKEVNNAIQTIMLGGQEYRIGTRHLRRADLNMLRQLRNELSSQIESASAGGLMDNTYAVYFDRR